MTQPDEPAKQGVDPTAPYSEYGPNPYAPPTGYEPPAHGQPAAPSYGESAAPSYGQPAVPAYTDPNAAYGQQAAYGQTAGYGQQAGYGQPAGYTYGQPGQQFGGYPYPVAEPTNGLAIASLVVSILGAVGLCGYGLGGYLGIVGAILGHVAGRQIRERGGQGAGMAKAGVIVGWIATAIAVLATIAIVIFVVWAANQPPSTFE